MNTTWYLQSHFVWLRLSCSSIDEVSSRVLGGSRLEASSVGRLPEMSNCYCHPGRAGGSLGYSSVRRGRNGQRSSRAIDRVSAPFLRVPRTGARLLLQRRLV